MAPSVACPPHTDLRGGACVLSPGGSKPALTMQEGPLPPAGTEFWWGVAGSCPLNSKGWAWMVASPPRWRGGAGRSLGSAPCPRASPQAESQAAAAGQGARLGPSWAPLSHALAGAPQIGPGLVQCPQHKRHAASQNRLAICPGVVPTVASLGCYVMFNSFVFYTKLMDKDFYKDLEKIKTIGSTYMAAVGLVPTTGSKVGAVRGFAAQGLGSP